MIAIQIISAVARRARGLRPAGRRLPALAPLALASALSCGLVHKDIPITADFQVGNGLPTSLTALNSTQLTSPIQAGAGDVSSLSSVVLDEATLSSTDGQDLSFITSATISIAGNDSGGHALPAVELAKFTSPGTVGVESYTIEAEPDLRPYLEGSAAITVTVNYNPPLLTARALELRINIHATL